MSKYRSHLPQLDGGLFLSDGGVETTFIFHEGWELPDMAGYVLYETEEGRAALRTYYDRFIPMALANGLGFVLETVTWRASSDWTALAGHGAAETAAINRFAVAFTAAIRDACETPQSPMVVSGCVGPRGDGYRPENIMSAREAEDYHALQVRAFAEAGADLVTAHTMTNTPEAAGIVRAARAAGMPVVISFTVETDGRLPTGETLREAIEAVDATTAGGPEYYMINCAHPTHFAGVLESGTAWVRRLRGIRANSSKCSHAELDNAPELDIGNPVELGGQYADLVRRFPHINVLGGCCGTDHRHIAQVCLACRDLARAAA